MKEKIFFAHANGFPAEVYSDLFNRLPHFDISYISKLGHGNYTLNSSWKDITPEIIDHLEENFTEPVWAIGTGKVATLSDIAAMHGMIRSWLQDNRPEIAKTFILYGGSVKASNAAEIFATDEVGGALVGGASLKSDDFLGIIAAAM